MTIARTAATGGTLDPAFLGWQSSLPIDRRLLAIDCQGSIAHVQGLRGAGLLSQQEADTLIRALAGLPDQVASGQVVLPDEEDVHMAVETWLRGAVGAVADKLHTGRSRNDQVATDLQLWARATVSKIAIAIDSVIDAAQAWIEREGQLVMPVYTHRQVAVPALASSWIEAALCCPLARDRALLDMTKRELAVSPLGAGAIGATTLPIDPNVTAAALGFERPFDNPIDAIGQRDHAVLLAFVCARIGMHLARFGTDVVELASDGLVSLGGAIACGSSMMPHKRNPDLFELVRGHAALRHGELTAMFSVFHGLASGYHRDFQHDKQILFSAVDGTCECLSMIALGLRHIALVDAACMEALRDGDAIATDLTEVLVASGVPFREAYGRIGSLVASQRERSKRLCDLTEADLNAAQLPLVVLDHLDVRQSAARRAGKLPKLVVTQHDPEQ